MEKVKYTRQEYRTEYLKSDEWKNLRSTILGSGCECQCCKKVKANDVHHMVYRNIVDVTINDLIPVCRECHELLHQAIDDGWISQDPIDFDIIKIKTYGILDDQDYIEFREWLLGRHFLTEKEMDDIKKLQAYVIKKISAMIKKNVWYDDLQERKFTGRQILKIRQLINTAKYRRKNNLDWNKSTRKSRKFKYRYRPNDDKLDNYSRFDYIPKLKDMEGFKSRKSMVDID